MTEERKESPIEQVLKQYAIEVANYKIQVVALASRIEDLEAEVEDVEVTKFNEEGE